MGNLIPPQLFYSTVTDSSPTLVSFTEHRLVMKVRLTSPNLWLSPYSQYQQELFYIISDFHENDGWNFQQISKWLVENNYKTTRGKTFTHLYVVKQI